MNDDTAALIAALEEKYEELSQQHQVLYRQINSMMGVSVYQWSSVSEEIRTQSLQLALEMHQIRKQIRSAQNGS